MSGLVSKTLDVRLFFNRSNNSHYVKVGEHVLVMINAMVAAKIAEKEGLQIIHGEDIKHIQIMCQKHE